MKLERPPVHQDPNIKEYIDQIQNTQVKDFLEETDKRYFYWSELKYRPNNPCETPEDAWYLVKTHRFIKLKHIRLHKYLFSYNLTSFIQKDLHEFDLKLIGGLYKDSITPQEQQEFFSNSLLEEAIASSQIEGAATTTRVARDMIKSGRKPKNESEQMITNNFAAIREIESRLNQDLDTALILDIHEIMTANTDANIYAGKFRKGPVFVQDHIDGEIAHEGPNWEEVPVLVEQLCRIMNDEKNFIHPILKASILHFLVGFIHPFGDGNGRTARALYYWYLMKKGYMLIRHISISRAILESRVSYDKAFLKTEYDENDLTYFVMYSMKSLRVAFQSLVKYRDKKRKDRVRATEILYSLMNAGYNKRQSDLLAYLYLKPKATITISDYSARNDVVRQTGSKDLNQLEKKGLIESFKNGKNLLYRLVDVSKIIALID